LRRRIDKEVSYGTHQAIHMAIGLVFLGGGRASLSRSKESIAALMCAFYPRFSTKPDDNQYHLQAFRHLWVLAVEWRGLQVLDVDSRDLIHVPVTVNLCRHVDWAPPDTVMEVVSPCLLPEAAGISSLRVDSSCFFPTTIDMLHHGTVCSTGPRHLTIFVKRRAPCSSSHFLVNLLSDALTSGIHPSSNMQYNHDSLRSTESAMSYTNETWLQMLARLLCEFPMREIESHDRSQLSNTPSCKISAVSTELLVDCTSAGKLHILPLYLQIYHYAQRLPSSADALHAWSLRLCIEYLSSNSLLRSQIAAEALIIKPEFLASIKAQLNELFVTLETKEGTFGRRPSYRSLLGCRDVLKSSLSV